MLARTKTSARRYQQLEATFRDGVRYAGDDGTITTTRSASVRASSVWFTNPTRSEEDVNTGSSKTPRRKPAACATRTLGTR